MSVADPARPDMPGPDMPGPEMPGPDRFRATGEPRLLVLGPCAVALPGGEPIPLTGSQRRLLSCLALDRPRSTTAERLGRAVWPEEMPVTARASLHNQISRLRRVLGAGMLQHDAGGYRLGAAVAVDAEDQATMLRGVEDLLTAGEPVQAFEVACALLEDWRGTPYQDIDHLPGVDRARRSLDALGYTARTLRLEAAVAAGRSAWAIAEGESLLAGHPHDEYRALLVARALHAQGRRADALATLSSVRRAVRRDLGLEVGAELELLEQELIGATPATPPGSVEAAQSRPVYVGRRAELDAAVAAIVAGGQVCVDAAPGSGVSSFLRQVRRWLGEMGFLTVLVRCSQFPESALTTLTDVLEELGGDPVRQGVWEGFLGALAEHGRLRPTAVLVDDAQHAGPSTRRALSEAARLPGVSVLLAGHGLQPGHGGTAIELQALQLDDLASLIDRAGVSGPDRSTRAAELARFSGGNPLLATLALATPEIWSVTADEPPTDRSRTDRSRTDHSSTDRSSTDQSSTDASSTDRPVGGELADVIAHWRTGLSRGQNELLDWAAVIGDPAPLALLRAVADDATGPPAADPFLRVDGDWVAFRHAAVRLAVHEALPPGRRTEMHHAVALAAAELGQPTIVVARQLWQAREIVPEAAAQAACDAAAEATLIGAHHDAASWLEAACALSGKETDPTTSVARLIAFGDALRLSGDPRHISVAMQAIDNAVLLGRPDLIAAAAFALLQLGSTSDFGGADQRLRSLIEDVLAQLGPGEQAAPVLAAASLAWSMTAQAAEARAFFDRAEQTARDSAVRRQVLPFAYLALGTPADLERRVALTEELSALADQAGDPIAAFEAEHLWVSIGLQRGDGARVRSASDRMDALLPRVGDIGRRWSALYTKAAIAHLDHALGAAEAWALQAHELFAAVSPERAAAAYHGQLVALWLAQGRIAELAEPLAAMLADQPGVPAWHAAYALALTATGRAEPSEVATHLRAALRHAEQDFTWLAAHTLGGRAAAAHGDPEIAADYARLLRPWSGRVVWQGTCSYGPVDTTLALLARVRDDHAATRRHVRIAAEVAARLWAPVFIADLRNLGLSPD